MQAVKCLVAPDLLGQQLLLQRGVMPGLVSLIRPQHLASLADWEARAGSTGLLPSSRTVQGLVAAILQEGVLQPQSTMLRDLYQVPDLLKSIGPRPSCECFLSPSQA